MSVRCIGPYRATRTVAGANVTLVYAPGEVVDDPALAAWLLVDAPGSWELVTPPAAERALDEPPAHRMVTRETPGTRRRTRQAEG